MSEYNFKNPIQFNNFNKDVDFRLLDASPRLSYQEGRKNRSIHWGQLKLLMSELNLFLYHLPKDTKDIVYVGAAPGNHIFILSHFFKDLNFHLYDSCGFDERLSSSKNVKIYQRYFTDQDTEFWKNKEICFISDIRTLSYTANDYAKSREYQEENEKTVSNDMDLQQKWVVELKPKISLLKFRLPFAYDWVLEKGKFKKYLKGTIMKQVFNKKNSSETRLLVKDITFKEWDILSYEEKMSFHNSKIRNVKKYYNPMNNTQDFIYKERGLKNDFDSTYFCIIISDLLKNLKMKSEVSNFKKLTDFIIENIHPENTNIFLKLKD